MKRNKRLSNGSATIKRKRFSRKTKTIQTNKKKTFQLFLERETPGTKLNFGFIVTGKGNNSLVLWLNRMKRRVLGQKSWCLKQLLQASSASCCCCWSDQRQEQKIRSERRPAGRVGWKPCAICPGLGGVRCRGMRCHGAAVVAAAAAAEAAGGHQPARQVI